MPQIKNIDTLFFELIRVAIGTQDSLSRLPSDKEWKALYNMAMKQSLVGVCFAALQRLGADADDGFTRIGISEILYLTWMGMAAKIQLKNQTVDGQCVALQKQFSDDGLRSSILKGQGIGQLYAKHLRGLRQSGDIDLYVDCGRDRTLAYLQSLGMKNLDWDYVHAHAPFYQDTQVEVHYRVGAVRNVWKNRSLQSFWKENEKEFFVGHTTLTCGNIICPSERMHLFFLIHHAYRHLITGGIGLRQIMDIFFVLQHRDMAHDEWLKKQVKDFGMKEFCEAMIWVMHEAFDMNTIDAPWIRNDDEGRFLLHEIMIGGNFGNDNKRFGGGMSKGATLIQITKRNIHLMHHYGSDAIAAPLYYVWHYCWKRLH